MLRCLSFVAVVLPVLIFSSLACESRARSLLEVRQNLIPSRYRLQSDLKGRSPDQLQYSLRNTTDAPVRLSILQKSCECIGLKVGDSKWSSEREVTIPPALSTMVRITVRAPTAPGEHRHAVHLMAAQAGRVQRIELGHRVDVVPDVELPDRPVHLRLDQHGFVRCPVEVHSRNRRGSTMAPHPRRMPPGLRYTVACTDEPRFVADRNWWTSRWELTVHCSDPAVFLEPHEHVFLEFALGESESSSSLNRLVLHVEKEPAAIGGLVP